MATENRSNVEPIDETADHLPFSLVLELNIHEPDTIAELSNYREGEEREQFAMKALRIGVLALRQARGQIDGELIRREVDRLLDGLQSKLGEHERVLHGRLATELKNYFDPQSGHLPERLQRLLKQDGELETVLRRQIGGQDSELCKTLTAHFGLDSPLMKMLSPDQSQGLLAALRATLETQLTLQRDQVLKQFSLDNKDGALARFIEEIGRQQGDLSKNMDGKIDKVIKEFSLDEENSALSRLVRNVDRAQRTITAEFSLDGETSALSRLKKMLEDTNKAIDGHLSLDNKESALFRLKDELLGLHNAQRETNQKFQEEVKSALESMKARREEAQQSTRHGLAFEEAVFQFVQRESQRTGDTAQSTGATTGLIKNCKIGDCLIELGPDTAAPGAKVVVEAKEKAGYVLAEARTEIEMARKNRGAQVGLFVFSKRLAPVGLEPLQRLGDDVFVIWDPEDANSDLLPRVAITLARALCIRSQAKQQAQAADFTAIDEAILEIEKRAAGFTDIEKWTEGIQKNSEKILDELRKTRKALERQANVLRERTDELKLLLANESESVAAD